MNVRDLLGEVWRNLRTGTTRAALFAVGLGLAIGTLAVADARGVVDLHRRADAFIDSGASVRVVTATDHIDGATCEALIGLPAVRASGALAEGARLRLSSMPDHPVPVFHVTPRMAEVLGVRAEAASGVWVSDHTADLLGVGPGQELRTGGEPMTVAGVFPYPDDGRDSRLRYAVVVPGGTSTGYDECWADTRPPTEEADDLLLWAVRAEADPTVSVNVAQLNTSLGATFDGAALFAERPTRFALPAAALVGLVLGFVSVRLRRLEMAGALHVGVSRRALLVGTVLEAAAWSLAGLALSLCALVVAAHVGNPADPWETFAVDVWGPVGAVPAVLAGAVAAVSMIREEHLFRYFKDR
ncbi:ABC transporter permease [Nocardiopsis lucentensis]|uniref:ABC transporter permease n=1 Tax=Nocardiopsis lucentensis TaxID=53441 RepID=UPI00034B60C7|nr:ABC transporter permease [Nocardiopsis lucentensis]